MTNKSFVTERDQCPEGALTPMSKLQSKINYIIVENSPDKFQEWKSTKSNNSKSMMPRVMFLVHCTSSQWDLSTYEIQVAWIFFNYAADKIQERKWTKGNNSKSMKLWVMVLVHSSSMRSIYLWSFMLMLCIVLKLCSGKRDGWTDRQTDGRTNGRTSRFL